LCNPVRFDGQELVDHVRHDRRREQELPLQIGEATGGFSLEKIRELEAAIC
jgi:hypothetical protein